MIIPNIGPLRWRGEEGSSGKGGGETVGVGGVRKSELATIQESIPST